MYESIVSEALRKSGYDLYYYKKEDSTLEQDFFVRTREWLVPGGGEIEKRHRQIHADANRFGFLSGNSVRRETIRRQYR